MGYESDLLVVSVPIPVREGLAELSYTHFTVSMDTARRIAAVTAVNIDGSKLRNVKRSDNWQLDDRLPRNQQSGPELYVNNDIDRGHLVRRNDPVWGPISVAEQANRDTFHYTVCAPQTAELNQSKMLWLGLEDYVLEHARQYGRSLSVFTGCIFDDEDPVYRDIAIPRRFFKVAAWMQEDSLATTGYVLDQSESLDRILNQNVFAQEIPPLGAYRTYQVPVEDIAEVTGLTMPDLVDADRLTAVATARPIEWTELHVGSDLVF